MKTLETVRLHADFGIYASRESQVLKAFDGFGGGIGDVDKTFMNFHFKSFAASFVDVRGFDNGEG